MDFCWAAGAKRSNSTKKKKKEKKDLQGSFQLLIVRDPTWTLKRVWSVFPQTVQRDNTTVKSSVPSLFPSATCLSSPASTKHVRRVIFLTYVEHCFVKCPRSLHLCYSVYSCAHFHIVIYSWSLRTSEPQHHHRHHHHRPHLVWSLLLFFFFNCQPQEKKAEKRDKVRDKTADGPRLFLFPFFLALARSCQSLQLCRAEELAPKRLRSSSAAVRAAAWCYNWEAKSAEGEGSRAQRAIPQAASNELTLWDDRKDDCTATLFPPLSPDSRLSRHLCKKTKCSQGSSMPPYQAAM